MEKEIGPEQFPVNEHYFGLVNVSCLPWLLWKGIILEQIMRIKEIPEILLVINLDSMPERATCALFINLLMMMIHEKYFLLFQLAGWQSDTQ